MKLSVLLTAVSLSALTIPSAWAQTPAGQAVSLPSQDLAQSVAALSARYSVRIGLADGEAGRSRANAVSDASSIQDALEQLLAGTGLSWREVSAGSYEIVGTATANADGSRTLQALRIEGSQASNGVFANLDDFGAGAGANGSSDVTATEGTGSLTVNGTSVASKTARTLREVPQTVATVSNAQIRQQNLNDVTDVLTSTPGVTILQSQSASPRFLSRGFEVKTFQIDGGGPIQAGDPEQSNRLSLPDLSQYDHVEVVRGSSGLFAGAGDPGGVVNLQRKRPLDHQQALIDVQAGSWNFFRTQLDVSSPLALNDHVRGRFVAAYQDQDFFYDYAHRNSLSLFGSIETDLAENTLLRFGGSYLDRADDSPNSAGLPRFQQGNDIGLPRDTNYMAYWGEQKQKTTDQFLQIEHRFQNDWKVEASVTRSLQNYSGQLPRISGPVYADLTGLTYVASSDAHGRQLQYSVDSHLSGAFQFLGLEQRFTIGGDYNWARIGDVYAEGYTNPGVGTELPILGFDPRVLPIPGASDGSVNTTNRVTRQYGAYINLALRPIKNLLLSAGGRYSWYSVRYLNLYDDRSEFDFDSRFEGRFKDNGHFTPVVGLTYDLTQQLSAYGSYSDIYKPNGNFSIDGSLLPPRRGRTVEGGFKWAPEGGRLNASLAYYDTIQRNVGIYVDYDPLRTDCCYAPGGKIKVNGVDLTVSGAVTREVQINGGYTFTRTRYNDAYEAALAEFPNAAQTQQPEHQVKLWMEYTPTFDDRRTSVNAGLRLESSRHSAGIVCSDPTDRTGFCFNGENLRFNFTQGTYAIADARIARRFGSKFELGLNVTNLTDTNYYATAGTAGIGNFYGEPRRFTLSVRAGFGPGAIPTR